MTKSAACRASAILPQTVSRLESMSTIQRFSGMELFRPYVKFSIAMRMPFFSTMGICAASASESWMPSVVICG